MIEFKSSYHYLMGDLGKCLRCELGFFNLNSSSSSYPSLQIPRSQSWTSSLLWNPHHLRSLDIGDDFFGHPNRVIPTPFLLPNLVSNHFVICFLFYHIRGDMALVPPVGLGVDERTLDCKFLLVLLIRKLFLWLRALVGLVTSLMSL